MRRPSSWGSPKVPAGQGSIWTRLKSSMPRRRIAACQPGCALSASMAPIDSSMSRAGRASGTSSHESTVPVCRETNASATSARGPLTTTRRTRRAGTVPATKSSSSCLEGSCRPT